MRRQLSPDQLGQPEQREIPETPGTQVRLVRHRKQGLPARPGTLGQRVRLEQLAILATHLRLLGQRGTPVTPGILGIPVRLAM